MQRSMPSLDLMCKNDNGFKASLTDYPRSVREHDVKVVEIHKIKVLIAHEFMKLVWVGC